MINMETEKIKTIDEFLIEYMHHKPKVYNDGITERCYPVSAIIEMTEKYTSQFKQPPVSVMPTKYEDIKPYALSCEVEEQYKPKSAVFYYGFLKGFRKAAELASLSKEAPNERMPDVGETIKETAIDSPQKTYTREEVIKLIDEILQYPDHVIDACTNENTNWSAEDLLELAE